MSDQEDVNQEGNGAAAANEPDVAGDDVGQRRLAAVEAERDEMKDRMLRIAADFENWKKRARKEQEDGEAKVRETVLKDVLDVMDNLERAVEAYGPGADGGKTSGKPGDKVVSKNGGVSSVDGAAILKGVSLVVRLFQSKLERYGVKAIEALGQPFDPRIHEAISRTETAKVPAGNVAVELQRGYRIGERLLRPSMVSVATASAGGAGNSGDGTANGDGGNSSGGVGDKGA
ncbi:MAG: nucleotide exchange factor GrpE [Deltaproteobacteria bacterium]|nr:nucleotide exchange factor GrpE [Deltaproteobacteria bacterium]